MGVKSALLLCPVGGTTIPDTGEMIPGEDLNPAEWESQGESPDTNPWPTSDTSTVTLPSDGYYRACMSVCCFDNTSLVVEFTFELQLNGSPIDSFHFSGGSGEFCSGLLKTPDYPLATFYHAGDVFSGRISFDSGDGLVDPTCSRSEEVNFLRVEGWFDEGYEDDELCPDVLALIEDSLFSEARTVQSYDSVALTEGLLYKLKAIGQDLSMDSAGSLFVVEGQPTDSYDPWAPNTDYCQGTRVLASDGNIYIATAASGLVDTSIGYTGLIEPTWPGSGTVTDGDLTWTFDSFSGDPDSWPGPHVLMFVGQFVVGSDGNFYAITSSTGVTSDTCGTSGGSDPTWDVGSPVSDGGVTWEFLHVANTGDPRAFIEKFDDAGVSLGEWGPDFDADLGLDATSPFALVVDSDDSVWLLGWKTDPLLCLFHIDPGGALIDSWDDLDFGTFDTLNKKLSVDISTTGFVYYTEMGNVAAKIYEYDPTMSSSSVVVDRSPTGSALGAFRLMTGTQIGGAIAGEFILDTFVQDFTSRLSEFNCDGSLRGWIPIFLANPDRILVAFSEDRHHIFSNASSQSFQKYDLNTGAHSDEIMLPVGTSAIRLASCKNILGKGFRGCEVRRRMAWVGVHA